MGAKRPIFDGGRTRGVGFGTDGGSQQSAFLTTLAHLSHRQTLSTGVPWNVTGVMCDCDRCSAI